MDAVEALELEEEEEEELELEEEELEEELELEEEEEAAFFSICTKGCSDSSISVAGIWQCRNKQPNNKNKTKKTTSIRNKQKEKQQRQKTTDLKRQKEVLKNVCGRE